MTWWKSGNDKIDGFTGAFFLGTGKAIFGTDQTQFSNFRPFIRLNSLVLFVTRIELLERLIDAINKSTGPIGTPESDDIYQLNIDD